MPSQHHITESPGYVLNTLDEFRKCNIIEKLRSHTEEDRGRISYLVSEGERELARYRLEKEKPGTTIPGLPDQEQELVMHIKHASSLLSPIRKLNNDIMVLIFTQLLYLSRKPVHHDPPSSVICYDPPIETQKSKIKVPFLDARHVCAWLYKTIGSTRSLWTWINLRRMPSPAALDWLFEQSGGANLHVAFNVVKEDDFPPLLAKLSSVSKRIESLKLPNAIRAIDFLRSLAGTDGRLKELQFGLIGQGKKGIPDVFVDATALVAFTLGVGFTRIPQLPWLQLQALDLVNATSADQILEVLAQCPNLLSSSIPLSPQLKSPQTELTCSTLHTLTVRGTRRSSGGDMERARRISDPTLLPYLTLPSLKVLNLEIPSNLVNWTAFSVQFQGLLNRSNFTLSTLSLILVCSPNWSITHEHSMCNAILSLLSLLPSLTSLTLREYTQNHYTAWIGTSIAGPVIDRLTLPDQSKVIHQNQEEILLPRLEVLSVTVSLSRDFQEQLLAMVQSRQGLNPAAYHVSTLKRLRLLVGKMPDEDIIKQFQDMEVVGHWLQIVVADFRELQHSSDDDFDEDESEEDI